jgi:hypothetical protein
MPEYPIDVRVNCGNFSLLYECEKS